MDLHHETSRWKFLPDFRTLQRCFLMGPFSPIRASLPFSFSPLGSTVEQRLVSSYVVSLRKMRAVIFFHCPFPSGLQSPPANHTPTAASKEDAHKHKVAHQDIAETTTSTDEKNKKRLILILPLKRDLLCNVFGVNTSQ